MSQHSLALAWTGILSFFHPPASVLIDLLNSKRNRSDDHFNPAFCICPVKLCPKGFHEFFGLKAQTPAVFFIVSFFPIADSGPRFYMFLHCKSQNSVFLYHEIPPFQTLSDPQYQIDLVTHGWIEYMIIIGNHGCCSNSLKYLVGWRSKYHTTRKQEPPNMLPKREGSYRWLDFSKPMSSVQNLCWLMTLVCTTQYIRACHNPVWEIPLIS